MDQAARADFTTQLSLERWVLISTVLASSMAFIDGTALNVALPALQRDLGATGSDLLWIINAYLLLLSALLLVGGSLGDLYGRKRVFMAGIGVFTIASVSCGLAPTSSVLIISRAFQGLGGALMVPGSLSILTALVSSERRGRAIGTWSAFSTITTMLGPILGGYLADAGLWRGVFFINVPLGAAALLILATKIPESRDGSSSGSIDFAGAFFVTLGLAGVTYGAIEASGAGLADPAVFGSLALGLLFLLAFILVEWRISAPMVPFQLFRSRTFTGTNLLTLFLYAALSGGLFFLPLNLIQVQGYRESLAGFALLPVAILLTLLSRWAGGLVDRYGPRRPLVIGPLIAGAGYFLLAIPGLTAGPSEYWSGYLPGLLGIGLGMGITVAPLTATVMGSVPATRAGVASGINNAVARTAGVLAIALLGGAALLMFEARVVQRTSLLDLTSRARLEIRAEADRLGEAQVPPAALEAEQEVKAAYQLSFVDTFRAIVLACAALAWISALLAGLLVEAHPIPPDENREGLEGGLYVDSKADAAMENRKS